MQPGQLIALLGRPATDPAVEAALTLHRIRRHPTAERDETNPDNPVLEPSDWLLARRRGIEFGFEDQESFRGGDPSRFGIGPMLLTQIYFYGEHPNVHPYTIDGLPHGIRLDDDRATVRQRLVQHEGARRSWVRDFWALPDHNLVVSYAEDGARIASVLCLLPKPPSPPVDDIWRAPALADLIRMLGRRMDDSELQRLVKPLRLQDRLADQGSKLIAIMRHEFGLDMHFGGVRSLDATAFTNLFLYRDREQGASPWRGALPRGLEWNDSPEILFKKLGQPDDKPEESDFAGHALWHFKDYSLQVSYSTVYNWLVRLRIVAPGVWAAYEAGET